MKTARISLRSSGFTLVELLVAIAITLVLVACWAVPRCHNFVYQIPIRRWTPLGMQKQPYS